MVKYEWTGEFRLPESDEYFLSWDLHPMKCTSKNITGVVFESDEAHFILRRVETEEGRGDESRKS